MDELGVSRGRGGPHQVRKTGKPGHGFASAGIWVEGISIVLATIFATGAPPGVTSPSVVYLLGPTDKTTKGNSSGALGLHPPTVLPKALV